MREKSCWQVYTNEFNVFHGIALSGHQKQHLHRTSEVVCWKLGVRAKELYGVGNLVIATTKEVSKKSVTEGSFHTRPVDEELEDLSLALLQH